LKAKVLQLRILMPEALVAAEIPSASKTQIHCLREHGGYGEVSHLGLLKVAGADAPRFLQFRTRMTSPGWPRVRVF
jgi:glycine cleavage system aminomethyltransferase T